MIVVVCDQCTLDRLCDVHLDGMLACLRGVAALRGELWAESVARRAGRDRPWPTGEKPHAIAVRKVADLARDVRLVEKLADHAERWAARWWARA